jgi:CubicO group peptidase (beta-lactamase class C family)
LHAWIGFAVVTVAALAVVIAALVAYVNFTTPPLHTNPNDVPSVARLTPMPQWRDAADRSRELVRRAVVDQNLPGISVAVGTGGNIVWAEGFGWANIVSRVPVAPDMRFRIGHASVPLTSAAVGLLREQGKLHLDDEVQEYVPGFPKKDWPVTLRQLMANVAGVRHYKDTEWGDKPMVHCERAAEGLESFANDPLLFQPETKYHYSTYGWVVISAAIEAAAGESFFQFMRANLFEPLGMLHTTWDSATEASPDRVTSYVRGNLGREITTGVDYSCFAGGGAFLSTPSDLVRFGMALTSGTLLQPGTVRMLQTRQQLTSGVETDYGLGWMLETVELAGVRTRIAGYASRTIEGASTWFLTVPETGLVVAVSANISFADPKSIALAVAEAFARPGATR